MQAIPSCAAVARRGPRSFVWVAGLAAAGAWAQGPGAASAPVDDPGRALFAVHCARCHGDDARGTPAAPNLRLRVVGMSEAAFSSAVLQRYRWTLPAAEGGGESAGFEAMIRGVLSRQQDGAMPAWETQPEVTRGVRALYAYLQGLPR